MRLKITKLYTQRDSAWKSILLGFNKDKKYTIGDYGCLLTAISAYLFSSGRKVNPAELNELLKGVKGFVKDTGLYIWDSLGWLYPEYQIVHESPRYEDAVPDKEFDTIKKLIKSGLAPIIEVDFDPTLKGEQMHFLLGVGVENDEIMVLDPWVGQIIPLKTYGDPKVSVYAYKAYGVKIDIAEDEVTVPSIPDVDYPAWKSTLWRAVRVFVSGCIGVVTVDLVLKVMNTPTVDTWKYALAVVVTAGVSALGKWLRDTYGSTDGSKLIDKLFF